LPRISHSTHDSGPIAEITVTRLYWFSSIFAQSTGDEAGSAGGGMVTSTVKGKAEFMLYSFDVQVEGKAVCRLADIMGMNKTSAGGPTNTPPFPLVQPPLVALPVLQKPEATMDDKLQKVEPEREQ
jgi:hypothetical protein